VVVALSLFLSSVYAGTPVVPEEAARGVLPEVDFADVAVTAPLNAQQHAYLKPKQHRLAQHPYAQTDFTAYTLEWGEVKLGLIGAYMGILPRIQVGTQPLLDVMGIANVNGKFNLARTGPVDVAVVGSMHRTEFGEFTAEFAGAGGLVSIRVAPAWSIHVGGLHGKAEASGLPTEVPAFLAPHVDHESVSEMTGHLHNLGVTPNLSAKGTLIRVATDVRFNRRDSLLLQGTTFLQSSYSGDLGDQTSPFAEDILGILVPGSEGSSFSKEMTPEGRQYVLTVSYQMSFRQLDMRMGGGRAANPIAWIVQGNDVAWRFGGKTRAETRRTRRGWRVSGRKDLSRQETPLPERAIESTSQRNVGSASVSRKE
jgi:hypothetical protein